MVRTSLNKISVEEGKANYKFRTSVTLRFEREKDIRVEQLYGILLTDKVLLHTHGLTHTQSLFP